MKFSIRGRFGVIFVAWAIGWLVYMIAMWAAAQTCGFSADLKMWARVGPRKPSGDRFLACRRCAVRGVEETLGRLDLIFHPVAFAFDDHRLSMVEEAVQHGAGQGRVIVEDLGPVFIGLIGREHD